MEQKRTMADKEQLISKLQGKWRKEDGSFQFEINGNLLFVNDSPNPVSGMDFTLREIEHHNWQFYCPEIKMVADYIQTIGRDSMIIRGYSKAESIDYTADGLLVGGTLVRYDRL